MPKDPFGQNYKEGNKPPSPDDVAPRGTPEWREAYAQEQAWIGQELSRRGATGDPGKAKKALEDMTREFETETGQELRKKIALRQSRLSEAMEDARGYEQMASDREHWRGGRGGRGLDEAEMASLREITGWEGEGTLADNGGIKGIPKNVLAAWSQGMKVNPQGGSVGTGGVDMWPGNQGMEGSLPSYADPKYNPVDSWGGWSGVYGNQQNPANPAGLGQAPLANPAGMPGGQPVTGQQGLPSTTPVSLGVGLTPGRSIGGVRRGRRKTGLGGSGLGQPTNMGVVDPMRPTTGQPVTPQATLIRR